MTLGLGGNMSESPHDNPGAVILKARKMCAFGKSGLTYLKLKQMPLGKKRHPS